MADNPPASPVQQTVINFPNIKMEDFDVPRVTNKGYPQVKAKCCLRDFSVR